MVDFHIYQVSRFIKDIDLGPRDDLESLAYIAFFLLRGDLPWRASSFRESIKNSMRRIRASKAAASGDKLGASFPAEFGYLLDYSRRLEYHEMPDYAALKAQFADLQTDKGQGPLDWSSIGISICGGYTGSGITGSEEGVESDEESEEGSEEENFTNSYVDWDIADWDVQDARDRSLTLPIEQVELADSSIPQIVQVTR